MQLTRPQTHTSLVGLAALVALALAGCGKSPAPAQVDAAAQSTDTAAQQAEANDAAAQQAEALAAKEQELADREAAVKQQEIEAELARRNAESA